MKKKVALIICLLGVLIVLGCASAFNDLGGYGYLNNLFDNAARLATSCPAVSPRLL